MKKILLVDDEQDFLDIMKMRLEALDYEVMCAINGEEAIQNAHEKSPDIIILDGVLPVKDGFQVCKEIKNDETKKHIPVLMLTGKSKSEVSQRVKEVGANAYLMKPCESTELVRTIEELLR